jgi:carbonic anhydrase
MYLTAMSAVSLHNLANNIEEVARGYDTIDLKTRPTTNWTLSDNKRLIEEFPQCNGTHQSPIMIDNSKTRENLNLRLGLTAYDKPVSGFIANHFPTFRLMPFSFEWPRPSALISNNIARSFNPFADSHFILDYVQFYWSTNDQQSPGHQLDNQSVPMEIHFVHINSAYANLNEALSRPDGLLIFAVLVVPSTHESYIFDRMLDEFKNLTEHSQQVNFDEDSTWRSLLPSDTSRFYRYHGSLMLPPCHESVQWIVFDDKLRLGHKQLRRLKRYRLLSRYQPVLSSASSSKDSANVEMIDWSAQRRPLQQLNNRTVERSFSTTSIRRSILRQ